MRLPRFPWTLLQVALLAPMTPARATELLIGGSHGVVSFDTDSCDSSSLLDLPLVVDGQTLTDVKDVARDALGTLYYDVENDAFDRFLLVDGALVNGLSPEAVWPEAPNMLLVLEFVGNVFRFDRLSGAFAPVPVSGMVSADYEDVTVDQSGEVLVLANNANGIGVDSFVLRLGTRCDFDPTFHAEEIAREPTGSVLAGGYERDLDGIALFARFVRFDPTSCQTLPAPPPPPGQRINEVTVDGSGNIFAVVSSPQGSEALLQEGSVIACPELQALDLDTISVPALDVAIFLGFDAPKVQGTSAPFQYEFSIEIEGVNDCAVTPPGGEQIECICAEHDPGQFSCDVGEVFPSFPAMVEAFPLSGSYLFEFNQTTGDPFSQSLDYPDIGLPNGYVSIVDPQHMGTATATPSFAWEVCGTCTGDIIFFDLEELPDGGEVFFDTKPVADHSFKLSDVPGAPSMLNVGTTYEFDVELLETGSQTIFAGPNRLDFFIGHGNSTHAQFTVPEPGAAASCLLALGAVALLARPRSG